MGAETSVLLCPCAIICISMTLMIVKIGVIVVAACLNRVVRNVALDQLALLSASLGMLSAASSERSSNLII